MTDHDLLKNQFVNKEPIVREIYDTLMNSLVSWEGIQAAPKKTSIHLDRRTSFAGVHTRKKYINLNIRTDYPIEHPRIEKSEQISKNRYHHLVRLDKPEDIDDQLLGWLRDAYELSG